MIAPGTDGIWNTADDLIGTNNFYFGGIAWSAEYDNPPAVYIFPSWSRQFTYDSAGTDSTWFTADDHISRFVKHEFGTLPYFYTKETVYTNAGTDGVWNTADDLVGSYSTVSWSSGDLTTLTVINN